MAKISMRRISHYELTVEGQDTQGKSLEFYASESGLIINDWNKSGKDSIIINLTPEQTTDLFHFMNHYMCKVKELKNV